MLAAGHSSGALSTYNVQLMQFDTIFTYREVETVCHRVVRHLETEGYRSVALPPFIPIDMAEGKYGMVGLLDLRGAAVQAGLGIYGKSGLLLTREYGAQVRLGAVVTEAELEPTPLVSEDLCSGCSRCIQSCPTKALQGEGKIDKQLCSRHIFKYGLRCSMKFTGQFVQADMEEKQALIRSQTFRELWQNFMLGNYYYCFTCQDVCPAGRQEA